MLPAAAGPLLVLGGGDNLRIGSNRGKTIRPRLWREGNAPLLPTAPPPEGNAIKLRISQIFSNRKLLRACGFIMQQNHNKSSHIFNKNY